MVDSERKVHQVQNQQVPSHQVLHTNLSLQAQAEVQADQGLSRNQVSVERKDEGNINCEC